MVKKKHKLQKSTTIKRNSKQMFSIIDDEVVMLSIENGEYYTLNKVASTIWNFLSEPRDLNTIFSYLDQEYHSEQSDIKLETLDFIEELLSLKVIEIDNDQC